MCAPGGVLPAPRRRRRRRASAHCRASVSRLTTGSRRGQDEDCRRRAGGQRRVRVVLGGPAGEPRGRVRAPSGPGNSGITGALSAKSCLQLVRESCCAAASDAAANSSSRCVGLRVAVAVVVVGRLLADRHHRLGAHRAAVELVRRGGVGAPDDAGVEGRRSRSRRRRRPSPWTSTVTVTPSSARFCEMTLPTDSQSHEAEPTEMSKANGVPSGLRMRLPSAPSGDARVVEQLCPRPPRHGSSRCTTPRRWRRARCRRRRSGRCSRRDRCSRCIADLGDLLAVDGHDSAPCAPPGRRTAPWWC